MAGDTLYDLLDVRPDATTAEIRATYLKLSKTYHPDSGGTAAFFRQLQQAYEVLSDTGRRAEYDASLGWGTGSVRDHEFTSHAGTRQAPGPGSRANEAPRPPNDQPPNPPSSSPRSFDLGLISRKRWFWALGFVVVLIAVVAVILTQTTTSSSASSASTVQAPPPTATPSGLFPPTSLSQAKALAATGDTSGVRIFRTTNNGLQGCFDFGISIVVPRSLTGQPLAAALLRIYFRQEQKHLNTTGCGGMSIDAYNSQSEASPNGPLGGTATAGNVQLVISDSSPKHSVSVDLGPAAGSTDQFSFSY
jgi:DnaJ-like protein